MSHDAHHGGGHGHPVLMFGALALTAVAMVFGMRAAAGVARVAAFLFLIAVIVFAVVVVYAAFSPTPVGTPL